MLFTEICFGIWFAKQKCSVFSFCNKVLMNFSCCDLIYRDQAIFYRTCWPPFSLCQLHQDISDCFEVTSIFCFISSDRSPYTIVMMVYYISIRCSHFLRFSLSPLMQLMLQVQVQVSVTLSRLNNAIDLTKC